MTHLQKPRKCRIFGLPKNCQSTESTVTSRNAILLTCFACLTIAVPALAAYYDDGNDRQSLNELRQREVETLLDEERAILQAANRTGALRLEDCAGKGLIANGLLVQVNGRDAVLTSAHHFNNDKLVCSLSEMKSLLYYPNISYWEAGREKADATVMVSVGVALDAAFNLESLQGSIPGRKDFVIFPLVRQISGEIAPDGSVRGFLRYDTRIGHKDRSLRQAYPGFILGMDGRYSRENGGIAWSYQACSFHEDTISVAHSCDTSPGSSGSLLGVFEGSEIRLTGINNHDGVTGDGPLPASSLLNNGLLVSAMERLQPDLAFER